MSETSINLTPPLPDGLRGGTLTWVAAGAGTPKPTTRERAAAAILERKNDSGFDDQVRLTVEEADVFLNEVDALHGRRPSRPTAPKPSTRPQGPPAPASNSGRAAGANRSTCSRCGGRLQFNGPQHVVHIEDLDAFYRREFDQRMLATTTVYLYECTACHHIDTFTTAT